MFIMRGVINITLNDVELKRRLIKSSKVVIMDRENPTPDTPDVDTIEEINWESANALVERLVGQ